MVEKNDTRQQMSPDSAFGGTMQQLESFDGETMTKAAPGSVQFIPCIFLWRNTNSIKPWFSARKASRKQSLK